MKKVIEISKYDSDYKLGRMLEALINTIKDSSDDYVLILELVRSNSIDEILEEYSESEEDEY